MPMMPMMPEVDAINNRWSNLGKIQLKDAITPHKNQTLQLYLLPPQIAQQGSLLFIIFPCHHAPRQGTELTSDKLHLL